MAITVATIDRMSKKPPKPSGSGPGRPPGRKPTTTIFARVSPRLGKALDDYIDSLKLKPTITGIVELSLKEYLASQGFWPPKDESEE